MARPEHQVFHVSVIAEDDSHITMTHTRGMRSYEFLELIIYGLSAETGMRVINSVADFYKQSPGFCPDIPFKITGIKSNFMAKLVTPEQSVHRLGKGHPLTFSEPMMQIVWADKEDRWPWEEGFDQHKEQYIPLLFLK